MCQRRKNRFSTGSIQQHILAGQISSATGLEADDDIGDLHVSLLLQVGQDAGSEEDFALTNAVEVGVQLQGFDLQWQMAGQVRGVRRGASVLSGSGVNSSHHELAGLLAVHEALWDGVGGENFVPKRRTRRKELLNWLDSRLRLKTLNSVICIIYRCI